MNNIEFKTYNEIYSKFKELPYLTEDAVEMKISCKDTKNIVTIALSTCHYTYRGQVTVKKFLE